MFNLKKCFAFLNIFFFTIDIFCAFLNLFFKLFEFFECFFLKAFDIYFLILIKKALFEILRFSLIFFFFFFYLGLFFFFNWILIWNDFEHSFMSKASPFDVFDFSTFWFLKLLSSYFATHFRHDNIHTFYLFNI